MEQGSLVLVTTDMCLKALPRELLPLGANLLIQYNLATRKVSFLCSLVCYGSGPWRLGTPVTSVHWTCPLLMRFSLADTLLCCTVMLGKKTSSCHSCFDVVHGLAQERHAHHTQNVHTLSTKRANQPSQRPCNRTSTPGQVHKLTAAFLLVCSFPRRS